MNCLPPSSAPPPPLSLSPFRVSTFVRAMQAFGINGNIYHKLPPKLDESGSRVYEWDVLMVSLPFACVHHTPQLQILNPEPSKGPQA
jgi:hypothetical protein